MSVPEKIQALSDLEDKRICQTAYDYLMSSLSSSYLKYHAMRAEFIYDHKEPSVFAMYTWEGIECALWPHLYPFTTWCESIHDGHTSRKSSKVSFITKCLSAIIDYCLDFDLLQYVFDRWLYKTITGAINTYRSISQSQSQSAAFLALEDKPFSTGYWQWQHRYLLDAVHQFGMPTLFITISPSEWTFPWPMWLKDISSATGYGPTTLPFFETIHFMNVLEQLVHGYLCGSNDSHWRNHLFNYNRLANKRNVKTYFYRFEFQKRGTIHLHLLVWLDNVKYIQYERLRADLPTDNAPLPFYVNKYQISDKSHLPIHDGPINVIDKDGTQCIQLSHPANAFAAHLRGYIDTVLPTLQCSMDVQTTNGGGMILKYVASYVSKAHESYHSDALYCRELLPSTAVLRYALSLDMCEPEMWVLLPSKKIPWSDGTRKKLTIPTYDNSATNNTLLKYYNRPVKYDQHSLLQWLHCVDESKSHPKDYSQKKTVLVGVKHLSYMNPQYFFQHLLLHYPHRDANDIAPVSDEHLPSQILHFHTAHMLMPEVFLHPQTFIHSIDHEGHKQYYLLTLKAYIQSLIDLDNLFCRQLLPTTPNTSHGDDVHPSSMSSSIRYVLHIISWKLV